MDTLGAEDQELLEFLAEHRFAHSAHIEKLLDVSGSAARGRLRALTSAGYLRRERPFGGWSSFFLITAKGLRAAGSRLRAPRFDLSTHEHDLALGWMWLAARAGVFGALEEVVAERRMRSEDATRPPGVKPHAIRLGGHGAGGRERLHYPDLVLVTPEGHRVAIELELTAKGRSRREKILGGYAADARIDAVLYLVTNRALGRTVQASARRMGIDRLVHVQMAALPDQRQGAGVPREAERTRGIAR